MAIPTNKKELKEAIETSWQKLLEDIKDISEKASRLKTMDGHAKGTKMSPHDQLAYLLGWSELVLKWSYKKEKGEPVDFPETGYKWNELGGLAQKFYKDYDGLSFSDIRSRLNKNVHAISQLVEGKTNAELYKRIWYEKYTHGRMIQLNTASPFKNASGRIRKWTLKQK